jgi:hypothetical protein
MKVIAVPFKDVNNNSETRTLVPEVYNLQLDSSYK